MTEVTYSNTKAGDGWNYTRMTQRFPFTERIALAARIIRHGAVELELFWRGESVFIDAVSLRFGESRLERFKEEVPDETD